MGTTFLEVQPDVSTCRCVFCRITKQMQQNMGNVFFIDTDVHLGHIHRQRHVFLNFVTHLTQQILTELLNLYIFHFQFFIGGVLEFRQGLDTVGEIQEGLHLRNTIIKFLQGRLQLGRDIANEFSLQCITFVGEFDGLLLLSGQQDEAHQHNATHYQSGSKSCQNHTKANNNYLTRSQRAVLFGDSGLIVGNLLL